MNTFDDGEVLQEPAMYVTTGSGGTGGGGGGASASTANDDNGVAVAGGYRDDASASGQWGWNSTASANYYDDDDDDDARDPTSDSADGTKRRRVLAALEPEGDGGGGGSSSSSSSRGASGHDDAVTAVGSRKFASQLESAGVYATSRGGRVGGGGGGHGGYGSNGSFGGGLHSRTRLFATPGTRNGAGTFDGGRGSKSSSSSSVAAHPSSSSRSLKSETSRSRFSRVSTATASSSQRRNPGNGGSVGRGGAGNIVCAISENLARETCVASVDSMAPITLQVTKQGNGQAYAETIEYLKMLQPDEVLLNEGRENSQLAKKVKELYGGNIASVQYNGGQKRPRHRGNARQQARRSRFFSSQNHDNLEDYRGDQDQSYHYNKNYNDSFGGGGGTANDRFGPCDTTTVVKFVSRALFDQNRGATLLRRIAREESYDPSVVEEYIMLSSVNALVSHLQLCLGATLTKNSVFLNINAGGSNRMYIDRTTIWQLELLVNSKTGKTRDSLIGCIDHTKTTVGSRLLRTNIMSPPTNVNTIRSRQDLVETLLGSADFFHTVLEHLSRLPDVDKMLSNIALVPTGHNIVSISNDDPQEKHVRMASKGIAALVSVKSALSCLPSLVESLHGRLNELLADGGQNEDESTTTFGRTSLLVGLGNSGSNSSPGGSEGGLGDPSRLQPHHLLRGIIQVLSEPELKEVLQLVTDVFNPSTTYSRNAYAMRHQECFALRDSEDGLMSILRKAYLMNVDDMYKKAEYVAFAATLFEIVSHLFFCISALTIVYRSLPYWFLQRVRRRIQHYSEYPSHSGAGPLSIGTYLPRGEATRGLFASHQERSNHQLHDERSRELKHEVPRQRP